MKLEQAISNYLYYFKPTRNPVVWLWGVGLEEGETISRAIYVGNIDYLTGDEIILDALIARTKKGYGDVKKLSVDVMLINTDAAPVSFLREYLDKARVYVVKTDVSAVIKKLFKEDELTLVDEIGCGGGVEQLTWVRSNKLRR